MEWNMDKPYLLIQIKWSLRDRQEVGVEEIKHFLADDQEGTVNDVISGRGILSVQKFISDFIPSKGFQGTRFMDPRIESIVFSVVKMSKSCYPSDMNLSIFTELKIAEVLRERSKGFIYDDD